MYGRMEMLKNEIYTVIHKLENGMHGEDRVAAFLLTQLKCFLREIESGNIGSDDRVFGDLRQFWLDSVPWCSELSRDVEKIIMMYADLTDASL